MNCRARSEDSDARGKCQKCAFFDALLKPHHDEVQDIPLDGIVRELERENLVQGYVKLIDNEQAALRLNDIYIDNQNRKAILLITYADKRGADPVFADLEKGTLRAEPKLDGEGVAISAHLGFSLAKNVTTNLYPAVLEDVPGIGRTRLEPFLRSAFKNASSYKFKTKNGKEQKTWPTVTLLIKQSEDLASALNSGGYLSSIEVTKYTKDAGFDEIEHIEEKATTTRIKVEGKPTGYIARKMLNSIKQFANSRGYVDMRVKWVNSYRQLKQVQLGTARADAGDALYGRVERVNFSQELPQCSEKINEEVRDKLLKLLK